jgi:hypothetical protein
MTEPPTPWIVQRHGGKQSDHWREVYRSNYEQAARTAYEMQIEKMRQGTVRLLHGDKIITSQWAPTLRTQW